MFVSIEAIQTSIFPFIPVDRVRLLPTHAALLFFLNRKHSAVRAFVANFYSSLFERSKHLQRVAKEWTDFKLFLSFGVISERLRHDAVST